MTVVADLHQFVRVCEERHALADDVAHRYATECEQLKQAKTHYEARIREELVKYVRIIRDLRDDRKVLATEIRGLRTLIQQRDSAAKRVADGAHPDHVYAARQVVGEESWRNASGEVRAGVLAVVPHLLKAMESNESVNTDAKKAERHHTATASELQKLRKEYELSQQVAKARLDQIDTERQRVEESRRALASLKHELSDLHTSQVSFSPGPPTPGVAPSPAPPSMSSSQVGSGLLDMYTASPILTAAAPKYAYVSLLCNDPEVSMHAASTTIDADLCEAMKQGKDEAVVSLVEKCRQLSEENDSLRQHVSAANMQAVKSQNLARDRVNEEKEALTLQKAELDAQLAALEAFTEPATTDTAGEKRSQALKTIIEQRDTYKASLQEAKDTLAQAREDIVKYKNLIDAKRIALFEKAKFAEEDAERRVETEKERFHAQHKELELLREQVNCRVMDSNVTTEVLELQYEEALIRILLVEEEVLGRPKVKPLMMNRRVQAPVEGESPAWTWEEGSPTERELEGMTPLELTVVLCHKIDENLAHTTVMKVPDSCTVAELLLLFARQMDNKFSVTLSPNELALTVTASDERALLEFVDNDQSLFLDPDEAPPYSTLFSPRDHASKRQTSKREYPCSDRPLRTLSYIYQNYVVSGVTLEDDVQVRVWFTVVPAAQPVAKPSSESPSVVPLTTMITVHEAARKFKSLIPEKPPQEEPKSSPVRVASEGRASNAVESPQEGAGGGGGNGGIVGLRPSTSSGQRRSSQPGGLFPPGSPRLPKRGGSSGPGGGKTKKVVRSASPLSPGPVAVARRGSPTGKNAGRRASIGVPGTGRRASAPAYSGM